MERDIFKPDQRETGKGRVQRVLDGIAEYHRKHQGSINGTGLAAAGTGVEVATKADLVAVPAIIAGAFVALVSVGADYLNNVLDPATKRAMAEDETIIMSAEEIQSALAASAKEGSAAS